TPAPPDHNARRRSRVCSLHGEDPNDWSSARAEAAACRRGSLNPLTTPIPSLTAADIASALQQAGKHLSPEKLATMRGGCNDAFRHHVTDRLLEAEEASPSDFAKGLERFAIHAEAVIADLEMRDRLSTATKREILKHAISHASKLRRAVN